MSGSLRCDSRGNRAQGFSERQVFHVETGFDWGQLIEAGASLSLFAEKRLIELRIPNGKPGTRAPRRCWTTWRARPKTRCC